MTDDIDIVGPYLELTRRNKDAIMTSTDRAPGQPNANGPPSQLLTTLLYLVLIGVLAQAIFAGLFISGAGSTRLPHLIVGSALPWFAIVPAAVAFTVRHRLAPWVVTGAILLPVGLWVQSALGHMPFAVTTAIHVPFGVALFGSTLLLTLGSTRSPSSMV